MLAGQTLEFFDLILIALSGMAVVMLELALIAGMIFVMARAIRTLAAKKTKAEQSADDGEDEVKAVIMSVISEDIGVPLDELTFTSIREV